MSELNTTAPAEISATAVSDDPEKVDTEIEQPEEAYQSYGFFPFPFDHEALDHYRPGGLHPMFIGDTIGYEGRYKVHRKLGAGGFSTVWLCRDQEEERWVAIKFGEMAVLKHFRDLGVENELAAYHNCVPDGYFIERGPNGKQFCFILPVLAGDIRRAWADYSHRPETLREICAQMVIAMRYLHNTGICHGDFRPANILYTLDDIENATEEDINELFPESEEEEVPLIPSTGEKPGPYLPKYIYSSTCLRRRPEQEEGKVNVVYAAPEVVVGREYDFSYATDVWALAVSILEIRQHKRPFSDINMVEAVSSWEENLGPLPEPFRSVWIKKGCRGPGYDSVEEGETHEYADDEPVSWPADVMKRRTGKIHSKGYKNNLERIIREPSGLGMVMEPGEDLSLRPGQRPAGDGITKWIEYEIPEEEAGQLFDLMSWLFRYNPDERLTIDEVTQHPWFKNRFSRREIDGGAEDAASEKILKQDAQDDLAKATATGMAPDELSFSVHCVAEQTPEDDGYGNDDVDMPSAACSSLLTAAGAEEGSEVFFDAEERPTEVILVDSVARICAWIKFFFTPLIIGAEGGCVGI